MQTVTSKLCAHATVVNDFFLLPFFETKKNKDIGIKCKVEKKGGEHFENTVRTDSLCY